VEFHQQHVGWVSAMVSETVWHTFVLTFAATTAYSDVRWRKIPRGITVLGVLAGLGFNSSHGMLLDALLATTVAFSIGLGLFSMGAIGGGDVKLMTALAAMLRLQSWAAAMNVAILIAALMAIVQIIRFRAVRQTLNNIWQLLKHFVKSGPRAHPTLNVKSETALRSPFGVAVAAGTAFVILHAVHLH
jgi:prepilin peptidase CpaA